MKKLMLALAVAIGSHALAADSLNDGLVAYYKFDGNANDSSGNGNHGTRYNCGPSADRNVEMDMAFYFSSSGWVSVPNSPSLDSTTNALSVSFWIDANPYMEGRLPILSGTESNQYYFAFADGVTHGAVGGVGATFCGAGGDAAMFSLGRDYPFGAFHHWVMTSSGGTIKIYLDGELIASKDGCGFPYAKGCGLLIGRTRDTLNGELNDGLDGRLDELRIYNRVLSDSEVQAIYQLEFPIPKYWTVKLVLNGGTCETDEVKVLDWTMMDFDTLPYPERFGYYFAGWFTDPLCMNFFSWWEMPVWEDMTLYAGWDRDALSINIDGGWVLCRWKQDAVGLSVAGVVENDVPANLVIPEETNAEPIEDIDAYAFAGEGGISNVVLGTNVRWIWEGAFRDCPDLQSVTILGDEVWIGAQAFALCPKLKVVRLKCAPPIVDAGSGDESDGVFFNSPNVRIVVESDEGWKDEDGKRITEWCGRKVFYDEPLANLGDSARANDIVDALKGFADEQLTARIKRGKQYGAFKAWHDGVCGGDIDKRLTLAESPCAWLSFALDADAPTDHFPTKEDVRISRFEQSASAGMFELRVSIDGVAVGDGVTAETLSQFFKVKGCDSVGGSFSTDSVTADFGTPTDGEVPLTVSPVVPHADSFFFAVEFGLPEIDDGGDGDEQPALPKGFSTNGVQCVSCSGKEWFDLGLPPTLTMKTQIKCSFAGVNEHMAIIGALPVSRNDVNDYRLFIAKEPFQWFVDFPGDSRITGGSAKLNTPYEVEFGNFYLKDLQTDETIVSGSTVTAKCTTYNIRLFRTNYPYQDRYTTGSVYYVRIFDIDANGDYTLVRNLVPCLSDSYGLGLIDLVEMRFYRDDGTSVLIAQ